MNGGGGGGTPFFFSCLNCLTFYAADYIGEIFLKIREKIFFVTEEIFIGTYIS